MNICRHFIVHTLTKSGLLICMNLKQYFTSINIFRSFTRQSAGDYSYKTAHMTKGCVSSNQYKPQSLSAWRWSACKSLDVFCLVHSLSIVWWLYTKKLSSQLSTQGNGRGTRSFCTNGLEQSPNQIYLDHTALSSGWWWIYCNWKKNPGSVLELIESNIKSYQKDLLAAV